MVARAAGLAHVLPAPARRRPRRHGVSGSAARCVVAAAVLADCLRLGWQPLDIYDSRQFELSKLRIARDDSGIDPQSKRRRKAICVRNCVQRFQASRFQRKLTIGFHKRDWECFQPAQNVFCHLHTLLSRNLVVHLTGIDVCHPVRVRSVCQQVPYPAGTRFTAIGSEYGKTVQDVARQADRFRLRRPCWISRSSRSTSRRLSRTRFPVHEGSPGLRLNMPENTATGSSGTRIKWSVYSSRTCFIPGTGGSSENDTSSPGLRPISSRISFGMTTHPFAETRPFAVRCLPTNRGARSIGLSFAGMAHLAGITASGKV